jgi:hypothetical protein
VAVAGSSPAGPRRGSSPTDPLTESRRAAAHLAQALAVTGGTAVVVDCESGPVRLALAARLAADLGGECLRIEDLAADSLAGVVRDHRSPDHRSPGHRSPDHRPLTDRTPTHRSAA